MAASEKQAKKNLLAKILKLIGRQTSPETRTGKAFVKGEELLTRGFTRLAQSDLYLNKVGRQMEWAFRSQAMVNQWREEWLRTMRMPTSTDVDDIKEHVRALHDQVEALGWQLETVLERIEALGRETGVPPEGRRGRGPRAQA